MRPGDQRESVKMALDTLRANKLTPTRLAAAALLYLVFAVGVIPILT